MSISGYLKGFKRRLKDRIRGGNATPGGQSPSGTSTPPGSINVVPASSSDPNLALSVPSATNITRGPASTTNLSSAVTAPIPLPAPTPGETDPAMKNPNSAAIPVPSSKREAWPRLESLLRWLNTSADTFGPLKAAVGGLVECIDIYESVARDREEYAALRVELESLCKTIEARFDGPMSPQMTAGVASLSKGLQKEVNYVRNKCERNTLKRVTEAIDDTEDILNCYRRIQRLMSQISTNANLEMWKIVDAQLAETRLKGTPISGPARYNSSGSTGLLRGKCTPNTRRQVIGGLHTWVTDPNGASAYWLNGMAGTGKTTIAYSFCAELEEIHALGASFFCSRSSASCSDTTLIVPTIAYQLALFSYPFRSVLCRLLGETQDIYNRDVTTQFQQMIVDTLMGTRDSIPPHTAIVIDALDECSNQQEVGLLLQVLLKNAPQLPIKFFISSRAEGAAYQHLMQKSELRSVFYLHEVEESFVREDIELYVKAELEPISPSPDQIAQLVQQAGRLFIYAATVIRYVRRSGFDDSSLDRLDRILKLLKDNDEINGLYTTILSSAFSQSGLDKWDKADMKDVLYAVICSREPLTVDALGVLLRPNKSYTMRTALKPFQSILHVSQASGIVTTLHASFADYLLNREQAGEFYCHWNRENNRLARACIARIGAVSPPFNVCSLESSHLFDEDVPDLPERISKNIPPELFYACSYWMSHVEAGDEPDTLKELVNGFLSTHLLLWMEIMNLKKSMDIGAQLISRAQQWCSKHTYNDALLLLVRDTWNFVTRFVASPASHSTPHIYTSMLALWPPNAPVSKSYTQRIHGLVEVKGTVMESGTVTLLARWTTDSEGDVSSMVISPDGSRLVIGAAPAWHLSDEKHTISIWDVHSGRKIVGPLTGHTNAILSIAYSPDGTRIVSSSSDTTMFVWDAELGEIIFRPLKGDSGILSVTYSLDGMHIFSGSTGGTICSWSASTGQLEFIFNISNGPISSIAFSLNSFSVALGFEDGSIRICDLPNRRIVHEICDTHTHAVSVIAYSPDGAYIASGPDEQYLWDAHTGQKIAGPLKWHYHLNGISYSPDGAHIASYWGGELIRIYDARSGEQLIGVARTFNGCSIGRCLYTPDGARIISADRGRISIWDAHVGTQHRSSAEGHTSDIASLTYSPDSTRIASGSYDSTICVWDADTGRRLVEPLVGHTRTARCVAYSPDGLHLVSGSDDKTLLIWDAYTGRKMIGIIGAHTGTVSSVAYLPDGTRIASGSWDGTICVWDASTGERTLEPFQGRASIESVACSPDSASIASCAADKSIRLWDASTGECVQVLDGYPGDVCGIVYLPDQQHIFSVTQDGTTCIWNTHTGQITVEPLEHLSDSGLPITSTFHAKLIAAWVGISRKKLAVPLPASGMVEPLAFTSDDTHVAFGDHNGVIQAWCLGQHPHGQRPEWELAEEGWVVDRVGQRLLWVPHHLRVELLRPGQVLHISRRGSFTLNFDGACLGSSWGDMFARA